MVVAFRPDIDQEWGVVYVTSNSFCPIVLPPVVKIGFKTKVNRGTSWILTRFPFLPDALQLTVIQIKQFFLIHQSFQFWSKFKFLLLSFFKLKFYWQPEKKYVFNFDISNFSKTIKESMNFWKLYWSKKYQTHT